MTAQNHAFNRMLAHLISGGMPAAQAAELVDQCRDEARADAWSSPDAARVAQESQSWHLLRAAVLATVDDPHVWDDGASEAEVLAAWVQRLAGRSGAPVFAPGGVIAPVLEDTETTQPIATLGYAASRRGTAPNRVCGGNSGRAHEPHLWDRSGSSYFCHGRGAGSIPSQHGPDGSEQDAAS